MSIEGEISVELLSYLKERRAPSPRSCSGDFVERIPRAGVEDGILLSSFRLSQEFEILTAVLDRHQRATISRVLGEAGFICLRPGKVYQPTIGEIRQLTDEELLRIEGVGERTVAILRALFGRVEK